jgi:hypothetical protein
VVRVKISATAMWAVWLPAVVRPTDFDKPCAGLLIVHPHDLPERQASCGGGEEEMLHRSVNE